MFGIGWSEFILIALVLLIVVGPRQLPSLLKKAGMVVTELKRAGRELQHQVTEEVRDLERTVGTVKSPNAMLRDAVDEAAYDTYDPYKDVSDSIGDAPEDDAPSQVPGTALLDKAETDETAVGDRPAKEGATAPTDTGAQKGEGR